MNSIKIVLATLAVLYASPIRAAETNRLFQKSYRNGTPFQVGTVNWISSTFKEDEPKNPTQERTQKPNRLSFYSDGIAWWEQGTKDIFVLPRSRPRPNLLVSFASLQTEGHKFAIGMDDHSSKVMILNYTVGQVTDINYTDIILQYDEKIGKEGKHGSPNGMSSFAYNFSKEWTGKISSVQNASLLSFGRLKCFLLTPDLFIFNTPNFVGGDTSQVVMYSRAMRLSEFKMGKDEPPLSFDVGQVVRDPHEEAFWLTEPSQNRLFKGILGMTPDSSGSIQLGLVDHVRIKVPFKPHRITFDSSGNLWATDLAAGGIGFVSRDLKDIKFIPLVGNDAQGNPIDFRRSIPYGITVGPDKNLWVTLKARGRIAQLDPDGNFMKEWPLEPDSQPTEIVSSSPEDGKVFFLAKGGELVGALTVSVGATVQDEAELEYYREVLNRAKAREERALEKEAQAREQRIEAKVDLAKRKWESDLAKHEQFLHRASLRELRESLGESAQKQSSQSGVEESSESSQKTPGSSQPYLGRLLIDFSDTIDRDITIFYLFIM